MFSFFQSNDKNGNYPDESKLEVFLRNTESISIYPVKSGNRDSIVNSFRNNYIGITLNRNQIVFNDLLNNYLSSIPIDKEIEYSVLGGLIFDLLNNDTEGLLKIYKVSDIKLVLFELIYNTESTSYLTNIIDRIFSGNIPNSADIQNLYIFQNLLNSFLLKYHMIEISNDKSLIKIYNSIIRSSADSLPKSELFENLYKLYYGNQTNFVENYIKGNRDIIIYKSLIINLINQFLKNISYILAVQYKLNRIRTISSLEKDEIISVFQNSFILSLDTFYYHFVYYFLEFYSEEKPISKSIESDYISRKKYTITERKSISTLSILKYMYKEIMGIDDIYIDKERLLFNSIKKIQSAIESFPIKVNTFLSYNYYLLFIGHSYIENIIDYYNEGKKNLFEFNNALIGLYNKYKEFISEISEFTSENQNGITNFDKNVMKVFIKETIYSPFINQIDSYGDLYSEIEKDESFFELITSLKTKKFIKIYNNKERFIIRAFIIKDSNQERKIEYYFFDNYSKNEKYADSYFENEIKQKISGYEISVRNYNPNIIYLEGEKFNIEFQIDTKFILFVKKLFENLDYFNTDFVVFIYLLKYYRRN